MDYKKIGDFYLLKYNENYILFDCNTLSFFCFDSNLDYHKAIEEIKTKKNDTFNSNIFKVTQNNNTLQKKLSSLTLCVATGCNLKCKYCYANAGSYGRSYKIMSLENMIYIFNKFCEIYPEGINNITFFGGEPLLARKDIIEFCKYINDYCNKNKIDIPTFSIVTNGTLINQEVLDCFNKYHFLITLSIDGVKEINDFNRIYKNKNQDSVYENVKQNLSLQKGKRKFFLACESTLTPDFFNKYKSNELEYYLSYCKELDFDFMIPFVAESENYNYNSKALLNKIEQFYSDLLDYYFKKWISNDYNEVPPSIASRICQLIKKTYPKKCIAGNKMFFVDSNYDVFPCQMFYNENDSKIFSLNDDIEMIKENINKFYLPYRNNIKECNNCIAKNCCTSWCAGASLNYNKTKTSVVPIRCFIEQIIIAKCICFIVDCKINHEKIFIDHFKKLSKKYYELGQAYEYIK